MPSTPLATAMMESAYFDANWRPLGEPPAWMKLGRPCGERTVLSGPRLEVLACEVDCVNLLEIGVGVGLAVADHRVGLPGLPELAHQVEVFVGDVVAQVVLGELVHSEVLRRAVLTGGDDVPTEATLGDAVESE